MIDNIRANNIQISVYLLDFIFPTFSDKPVMLVARVDEKISGLSFDPVFGRIYWTEQNKRQSVLYTDSNGNKLTTLFKNRENARNIVSCRKTG